MVSVSVTKVTTWLLSSQEYSILTVKSRQYLEVGGISVKNVNNILGNASHDDAGNKCNADRNDPYELKCTKLNRSGPCVYSSLLNDDDGPSQKNVSNPTVTAAVSPPALALVSSSIDLGQDILRMNPVSKDMHGTQDFADRNSGDTIMTTLLDTMGSIDGDHCRPHPIEQYLEPAIIGHMVGRDLESEHGYHSVITMASTSLHPTQSMIERMNDHRSILLPTDCRRKGIARKMQQHHVSHLSQD